MAELNLEFVEESELYCDGDSEYDLLELFKGDSREEKIAEIMQDPSWPMRYHLSKIRKNLLSWYAFNPLGTCLEVGAGCGALTGLLCQKTKNVTAIELTKRRAEIIQARHANHDNLTILAGNLKNINLTQKFDYVTCIGVLEYAGRYNNQSDNPHLDFLLNLKNFLKPAGTLIIAIENKYGLKYWAGAKEDHTGRAFDSIENYPANQGIRTFSKPELKSLLTQAGLNEQNFYYPLPDYKLPVEIFSDHYLPSANHNVRPSLLPYHDYAYEREYFFDEQLANDSIVESQMFDFFSNSFLVFTSEQ